MKNSIKILATVSLVFLLSFSIQAQTDDWTGEWNTKFGKVTITKNGDKYSGFLPKGQLTQIRLQDGSLIGYYSRMAPKFDKSILGKKGTFKFTLSADKKKFDGYHKSETDVKWGSVNWNGEKIIYQVVGTPIIIPLNTLVAEEFKWTGTWESDLLGKIKIFVKDKGNITGKYLKTTKDSDYVTYGDLKGSTYGSSKKIVGSCVDENGKTTSFTFFLDKTSDDEFTGYITSQVLDKSRWPNDFRTVYTDIKGKRINSGAPNMNTY